MKLDTIIQPSPGLPTDHLVFDYVNKMCGDCPADKLIDTAQFNIDNIIDACKVLKRRLRNLK